MVADEVRSLALRAAEAAKDTSGLIEDVVGKIEGGSQLVEQSTSAFDEVAESSKKVAALTNEIVQSIQEQSQGLTQINIAITEMDTVTQQNAATSEESASAAKDMRSQSMQLMGVVDELAILVEGESRKKAQGAGETKFVHPAPMRQANAAPKPHVQQSVNQLPDNTAGPEKKPEKASEIIPLEDEKFQDF